MVGIIGRELGWVDARLGKRVSYDVLLRGSYLVQDESSGGELHAVWKFDRDDAVDTYLDLRVPALVWLNYPIMMIMMIMTMM